MKARIPRLTLVGGACLILGAELLANAVVWAVACGLFLPHATKRRVMSLALIAWTLGLRHALDVDHISAIDNVTRHLVGLGQLPLTVGTFFSLGHSTIVIVVTCVIAISTSVADHLDGISDVGGVIGVSISASFLLLIGIINAVILVQVLRARKREKRRGKAALDHPDEDPDRKDQDPTAGATLGCISRLAKPLFKLIDRPWKMYPIGILFGIGFDTSSEIALLAVSALAKNNPSAPGIANSEIIILPFIFAAGMSLVDCADSVFMLFAYAVPRRSDLGISGRKWTFFHPRDSPPSTDTTQAVDPTLIEVDPVAEDEGTKKVSIDEEAHEGVDPIEADASTSPSPVEQRLARLQAVKTSTISSLSIVLTVISIVVALFISIVEFMGLAAQECKSCADAAANDPGLAGRWWRFWNALNDDSGYLGAGVVGFMVLIVAGWLAVRLVRKRVKRRRAAREAVYA